MKTYLSIFFIIFCLFGSSAQVSPYKYTPKKYTPVKNSSKTSGMINTMSKSNNTYIKKSSYKPPTKIANYHSVVASKNIYANGKVIGTRKLVAVGSNYKPSLNINKRPVSINTKGCLNTKLSLKANQLSIGFITESNPPSWLVPGVVFKASSLLSTNPTPVNYSRKPVKLTAQNVNSSSSIMVNNSERRSNLSQGVSKIFNSIKGQNVSALIKFDYREVHTLQELELYLNGSYSANFGVTSLSASLSSNYNSKNEYNFYLIKVRQYLFSIGTDDFDFSKKDFFNSPSVNKKDLVYISRIDYGRIVSVLVKSKLDLKEFKGSLEVKLNTLLSKSELKAGIKTLKRNENFEIKALFYGGDASGAVNSLLNTIENKKADISSYLKSMPSNPSLGRPISYTLRSLNGGYDVAINTSINQYVETCINKEVELKITLEKIKSQKSDDSDNTDDYGFTQWVEYKANNKNIKAGNKISVFNKYYTINPRYKNKIKDNNNIIFYGDRKNQIAISEGSTKQIGNYITFEIDSKLLKDKYSEFYIRNIMREYSGNESISMDRNQTKIKVDINQVIQDLIGINGSEEGKWNYYNNIRLKKSNRYPNKLVGVIKFKSPDGKREVDAIISFELL